MRVVTGEYRQKWKNKRGFENKSRGKRRTKRGGTRGGPCGGGGPLNVTKEKGRFKP